MYINSKQIGQGNPVYIIAEIGINHNGQLEIAKRLIEEAKKAGVDAVKFQKRTPELCVPQAHRNALKRLWDGEVVSYMEYREMVEFGLDEYIAIDSHCRQVGIDWFASVWDAESLLFIRQFDPIAVKMPSALMSKYELAKQVETYCWEKQIPVIVSTGMNTAAEMREAIAYYRRAPLVLMHTTSAYPCRNEELNLRMIQTLKRDYPSNPIGYSGHEVGLATTLAAVALGACVVERHFTLDRAMWGSDQAASVEPQGMAKLVRDIRAVEAALGDGVKKLYKSEIPSRDKLRGKTHSLIAEKAI